MDHGSLSGLDDDDHPQYLHLDREDQTLLKSLSVAANITIDGRDISSDGSRLDDLESTVANLGGTIKFGSPATVANWTSVANWTTIDIANYTSPDVPKAAILSAVMYFTAAGAGRAMAAAARKYGSNETTMVPYTQGAASANEKYRGGCMWIVECSANGVIEAKFENIAGAGGEQTFALHLLGYFK